MPRPKSCCAPKSRDQIIQVQIETVCSIAAPQMSPVPVMGVVRRTAVASQWWWSAVAEGCCEVLAFLRREQCPQIMN